MKTLEQYQCEICHTVYKSKVDALDCEAGHVTNLNISDTIYRKDCSVPETIVVTGESSLMGKAKAEYVVSKIF